MNTISDQLTFQGSYRSTKNSLLIDRISQKMLILSHYVSDSLSFEGILESLKRKKFQYLNKIEEKSLKLRQRSYHKITFNCQNCPKNRAKFTTLVFLVCYFSSNGWVCTCTSMRKQANNTSLKYLNVMYHKLKLLSFAHNISLIHFQVLPTPSLAHQY